MTEGPGEETQALPVTPAYADGSVQAPGWVLAGRYRVLDRLGVGGMAEVFRAHDEQLDRDVAVKVFRTPVDEPGNAQAPERRETELRALAQLSHPNLITLYDANLGGPDPAFLVTELVIGPNLADRLTEGPLQEDLVRTIGIQIADALAYVHTSGMVHRDVKPANILLGTDGPDPETATIRARLSDFGIVRVIDGARMTAAEFTLGTASYIAPEQARGADVDAAADVYALGLVLIEMLTGVRSFDGPFHEAVAARLVRAPEIPAGLPLPWPGLLAAMTALDPAQRPSAAEVADALRTSSAPVPPPPLPPPNLAGPDDATVFTAPVALPLAAAPVLTPLDAAVDEPRRSHRGAALAAAALAFVAIIATALVLLLKPSSHSPTAPQGGTTAPTTTAGQPSSNGSSKSGQPGVPVTAGGSGASGGASGSGASSGAPSSGSTPSGASSTHSASHSATHSSPPPTHSTSARPSRSSTSARPSSSTPRSSTSHTTSAPPSTSPATSSSAAAGSPAPVSGSNVAAPSDGP